MRRRVELACALALWIAASSCFTTALWGGSIETEEDGVETVAFNEHDGVDGWGDFAGRVLLTPFAVLLDICTSPVQAWLYGWDEEDDDD